MEGESPDREPNFDYDISPEVRRGVYANTLNIWHSPYEFALDWGLTDAAEPEDPDDPTSPLRIVVSSLRAFASLPALYLTCCGLSTRL